MIFVGQKISLESTITENGEPVPLDGATVVFEYYLPGNFSNIPDGELEATIISETGGTVEGVFPAELNTLSGTLRIQAKATVGGDTYRATTTRVRIYSEGA